MKICNMNIGPETKPKADLLNVRFEKADLIKVLEDCSYIVVNAYISVEEFEGKKLPVVKVEAEGRGGSLAASRVPGCPIPPCNG